MGNKLKTVDAETLLSTPMSKTMFIVDGLISQGVNVISGASKIGKSWLMLWLGLQVAQGNSVWGLSTLQCDVLYLSLEDTQRRIKDRLYNLTDSAPDNLYFAVTSGLIGGGLEEQITDFLTEHPATKLVIIDTLQKVRDSKGSAGKAGMADKLILQLGWEDIYASLPHPSSLSRRICPSIIQYIFQAKQGGVS